MRPDIDRVIEATDLILKEMKGLRRRIDELERRLKSVEDKAHDQVTLEDYYKKYREIPGPLPSKPLWPGVKPNKWGRLKENLPSPKLTAIC